MCNCRRLRPRSRPAKLRKNRRPAKKNRAARESRRLACGPRCFAFGKQAFSGALERLLSRMLLKNVVRHKFQAF